MKKIVFLLLIIITSCNSTIDVENLKFLNGYWQITKVIDSDGNKKEYPINEVYDYFELKNKEGFHKKVRWQVTGKFLVNNLENSIKIKEKEDDFSVEFKSNFGNHSDKIIEISETELVLKSKNEALYYYKKVGLKQD